MEMGDERFALCKVETRKKREKEGLREGVW